MSRPLPSSFDGDEDFYEESRWAKLKRRVVEEPLIPLGCAVTCWALWQANRSIKLGDKAMTNRMFRARIAAQGFTLVAMVAGSYYWQSDREKRKNMEAGMVERKAKEKRDAWIKELEVRDEEDKAVRAQLQARQQKRKEPGGASRD